MRLKLLKRRLRKQKGEPRLTSAGVTSNFLPQTTWYQRRDHQRPGSSPFGQTSFSVLIRQRPTTISHIFNAESVDDEKVEVNIISELRMIARRLQKDRANKNEDKSGSGWKERWKKRDRTVEEQSISPTSFTFPVCFKSSKLVSLSSLGSRQVTLINTQQFPEFRLRAAGRRVVPMPRIRDTFWYQLPECRSVHLFTGPKCVADAIQVCIR